MKSSIYTLLRRSIYAAKLGFAFYGTTKTRLPNSVLLMGRRQSFSTPQEGGYLNDVINVWLDDEYGLRQMRPAPPRTVLDIGANVGVFSLWATHNFRNATVHAYEPNPRVSDCLQANLAETPVRVFTTGLGAKKGRAAIVDCGESRLAATQFSEAGEIAIETLADAVQRLGGQVDLMKVDCEGAEWELLEDGDSLRRVKEIRMEYHLTKGHTLEEFNHKVQKLGFLLLKLSPNQGFGIAWLHRDDR